MSKRLMRIRLIAVGSAAIVATALLLATGPAGSASANGFTNPDSTYYSAPQQLHP